MITFLMLLLPLILERGLIMITETNEKMLLCGKRLKECRKRMGYTQQQLIDLIEALPENNGKIRNEKHLSSVERGVRSLSIEYATLLSKILKVRKEYLLGYDSYKNTSEISYSFSKELIEKRDCISYLISHAGYSELETSDIRYQKIYISSEDSEEDINRKIAFAKKGLRTFPEYDVVYSDPLGRKIHLTSSELDKIYADIESFVHYRLEKEFNDVTRYKYRDDGNFSD